MLEYQLGIWRHKLLGADSWVNLGSTWGTIAEHDLRYYLEGLKYLQKTTEHMHIGHGTRLIREYYLGTLERKENGSVHFSEILLGRSACRT